MSTSLVALSEAVEQKVIAYFESKQANGLLGQEDWGVYYGDQQKLPKRITACIEPNTKVTDLTGATRMVDRRYEVFVILYFTAVQSGQLNRREVDTISEEIETHLNVDPRLGGEVIHSYVTELASGYSTKDGALVKSSRLTFTAISKDRLPS